MRATDALLANVARDIDDGGHNALGHKATAVSDHAHSFSVFGEQGMCRIPHVGSGGGVGGKHTSFGELVVNEEVDTNGSGRVKSFDNGHSGDVKTQRSNDGQGL